ncbi:hypothetical protein NGB36_16405 [Streptomyces sp. RB6PN25]|uniref:Uncharacterized protein n=1 Tax=Streptomyces humicola TaxID=2953240 RepID=A0ABT1PYE6_9ACTN|nr:hypothetical protein [Streptomyces humicola]MCQ4082148.1 hypothetical protein [Streptomyces humicola]
MSEARNDTTDDRAQQAAALGAEGGKHRGPASSAEEDGAPAHGRHRRPEHQNQ